MARGKSKALSDEELEFYSRQIVLRDIGYDGQLRLSRASVCIAGVGGLGSAAAMQLAAMGVGRLRLVDYDIVEPSNLQRQHLYGTSSLGYPKVEVAARKLHDLNPHVEIEPLPLALHVDNAEQIIDGVDLALDGLDRLSPRYALNRACVRKGIPYVFGAAIMTFGNASTLIPGRTACLECFQGGFSDDQLPTCAVVGVHPSIIGVIASIEVSEAMRIILGQEPRLANKLLHCDIGSLEFEEVELAQAEDCRVCGSQPSRPPMVLERRLVTETCARGGERTFVITPRRNLALDMDQLYALLLNDGVQVQVKADLGVTFDSEPGRASLLESGVMIVEGEADEERVRDFYASLVIDRLGVPPSQIEYE